jgi:quinoprotein glucose dehydrogenase
MRTRHSALLIVTLISLTAVGAESQKEGHNWTDYGGSQSASKYVPLRQITKANVGKLRQVWSYLTGDDNAYAFNPIVVDGVMYLLAANNSLVALNAATGKPIWIHENLRGISSRGVNYWESKDRQDRRLIFQINHSLQAIDAHTGQSILSFGNKGLVSLKEGLNRDPKTIFRIQSNTPGRIYENLIILGSAPGEGYLSPPGDIRAFDVITGKLVWSFHTIPHPGEYGYDTWPKDAYKYAGAANAWGELSLDEKRGIVFVPTGSATYDYYGADRPGSNLFANCLIALDAKTGKRLWHFQAVHHDLWDYDLVAAPQLITIRKDGKTIDAVAQTTKHGFLFVFDRVTGEPVFPIEERAVMASDMPGEKAWPTQPFPAVLPVFARQKMTVDDINPWYLSNEERAQWKDRIASAHHNGLFTPPSTKETIALPGARGGSNWGTSASNPDKGMVYLLTQDWPSFYKLSEQTRRATGLRLPGAPPYVQGQFLYRMNCIACHKEDFTGGASVPTLVNMKSKLSMDDFRQVVLTGKGKMPAFPQLDQAALDGLFTYLGGSENAPPVKRPEGKVVASSGAPGGLQLPAGSPYAQYGMHGGPPYPEGLDVPEQRYYTDYGLDYGYVISPPWSSIVAYDLNKGVIKWKVPLGLDPQAAKEGAKDTGIFRGGERRGMIVTGTGLIFVATTDAKVRAYDEETGQVLWTADLPAGSEGIPAMYEAAGKQFLVVLATTPLSQGRRGDPGSSAPNASAAVREGGAKGYVAFALP